VILSDQLTHGRQIAGTCQVMQTIEHQHDSLNSTLFLLQNFRRLHVDPISLHFVNVTVQRPIVNSNQLVGPSNTRSLSSLERACRRISATTSFAASEIDSRPYDRWRSEVSGESTPELICGGLLKRAELVTIMYVLNRCTVRCLLKRFYSRCQSPV